MDKTHWRMMEDAGNTLSERCATVSAIRLAPQLPQKPRFLQFFAYEQKTGEKPGELCSTGHETLGDEQLMFAILASETQESVSENPALEEGFEFLADV